MGISLEQYRCAIGTSIGHKPVNKNPNSISKRYLLSRSIDKRNNYIPTLLCYILYTISISYIFILIEALISQHNLPLPIATKTLQNLHRLVLSHYRPYSDNTANTVVLFSAILTRAILYRPCEIKKPNILKLLGNGLSSLLDLTKASLTLFLTLLNVILIVISNCSLLNPGPTSNASMNIKNLRLFYQNVQGLITLNSLKSDNPLLNVSKILELQLYIKEYSPDIIILNETWLKNSIKNSEIFSNNLYEVFRLDRSPITHPLDKSNPKKFKSNGGGVLIAINSNFGLKPSRLKINSKAEILSVTLTLKNNKKLCLSTCYRVGTLGDSNFCEIKKHLHSISSNKAITKHVLVGDFNLDNINWDSPCSSSNLQGKFVDLFADHCLTQMVNTSTQTHGNTLDLVLTDTPHIIKNLYVAEQNQFIKSDHFAIKLDIDLKSAVKRVNPPKRRVKNYDRADWESINNEIAKTNWIEKIDNTDIFTAWNNFKVTLEDICDRHIPTKTIKGRNFAPWFDSDVKLLNKRKEKFRSKFKETSRPEFYKKYSEARKQLKAMIKTKMRDNLFDTDNQHVLTKRFWSYVKGTSGCPRIPEQVYKDKTYANTHDKIADIFNKYFFDQFSDSSNYDIDIDFSDKMFTDFKFDPVTICNILRNINVNKSPGPDGIHGKVLKNCALTLSFPLSILFNLSYFSGQLPTDWKLANVTPVHKKGDKTNVENYRPISLTSLIMKVMEKCIRDELYSKCCNLINDNQHGFLPNKSCTTQLINVIDDMSNSLNSRSESDIIYFDFAKAFDSVNHDIILHKLKHQYEIDGFMLNFIRGYLHDRQQRVVVYGKMSSTLPVKSGVPQGSILGPLLFILFINDITECTSPGTNIALYADDTKLWRKISSYEDCDILNKDIDALHKWAITNKMKFHPEKCKALSLSLRPPTYYILPFDRYSYTLGDNVIDYCTEEKDLGLTVNNKLSWESHQKSILLKAARQLGLVRRTCHFIKSIPQKRSLYITLVRSLFEHCGEIWSPNLMHLNNRFESIQKRAVKWIFSEMHLKYDESTYLCKLIKLDLLPLNEFFNTKKLKLFHKIRSDLVPINIPSYITRKPASRLSNSNLNYHISKGMQQPLLKNFSNTFFPSCIELWNALPNNIKLIESPSEFLSALREHMWSKLHPKTCTPSMA